MNNQKKSVHKSGNVASLLDDPDLETLFGTSSSSEEDLNVSSTFSTESGIEFTAKDLLKISIDEIEPWQYANRHATDFGDVEELTKSIKEIGQQQPAVVRNHPDTDSQYKYQLIFGRRRLEACKNIKDKKIIVIYRHDLSNDEALKLQHAENEHRQNVSKYSNAVLYKKLLDDGIYKNVSKLAESLAITRPSIYDVLVFNDIPKEIIDLIPDIHSISSLLAKEIASQSKEKESLPAIKQIAAQIGKEITSIAKLRSAINHVLHPDNSKDLKAIKINDAMNKQVLFTIKYDSKGNLVYKINKDVMSEDKIEKAQRALTDIFSVE